MRLWKCVSRSALAIVLLTSATARAQEMPADYKAVLSSLERTGDFKDGVLKVNIPRNDLVVTISQRPAPTPFGFGGWVALTKGEGLDVMMGDLVLTEDEVNPVMSAVLQGSMSAPYTTTSSGPVTAVRISALKVLHGTFMSDAASPAAAQVPPARTGNE